MAEGVNVRFAGELQRFVQSRVGNSGLYTSASEYIRDLVRRDFEREEQRKDAILRAELRPGIEARESDFEPLVPDELISQAKALRAQRGR
jgi:antitoxin ParD1/3/4